MSTNWIVLSSVDVASYMSASQVKLTTESNKTEDQTDVDIMISVIRDRSNYVRGRVSGRVTLSDTAFSVPPELKSITCWLIVEALTGRIPTLLLNEDQRAMIRRAYDDLLLAGTADFAITTPTDPTDTTTSFGVTSPSFYTEPTTGTRYFTRIQQEGV
jgi:hypothetical protein